MKAIIYRKYGPSEVLGLEDVERPAPDDDQVLVRVRAASLNPVDWHYMRGTPYVIRLGTGIHRPKVTGLGIDFAGTVESVGAAVSRFRPGDAVFGGRAGALAEYVCVREAGAVAKKPDGLTFEEAASIPIAATTALQCLRDRGGLRPGQSVLINGASGGVGTFAVQIARAFGAKVTGVCSTRNVDRVRSLGADHVIDYAQEDFAEGDIKYDIILDNVGNHTLSEYRRILNPGGTYVMIGGGAPDDPRWIRPLLGPIKAMLLSRLVTQHLCSHLAKLNSTDLTSLAELVQAGKIRPVIDRRYALSEVPDAIRYLEEGHARGKVIISISEDVG